MYLVFDIGGTNIRVATSLDGKTINQSQTIPTPHDFTAAMMTLKELVQKLSSGQKIIAAAVGVRALNQTKDRLVNHPYFPMWVNEPLKESLQNILGAPVYLENDAAMAGLGEATAGAGAGHQIVAYITIGTGVGGARIVDQKIDVSAFGFEPGQQILSISNDLYPYYNGLGYLESFISGTALEKRFKVKPEQLINPAIWDDVGKYLALGLNNTIVYWSPNIVVIGGGMASLIPLEAVQFHLKQTLKIFPEHPEIVKAKLGDRAGLLGALEYLRQKV